MDGAMEWIPSDGKHSRGRQGVRWANEINNKFAGIKWNTLVQDKHGWRAFEEAFVLQWTCS